MFGRYAAILRRRAFSRSTLDHLDTFPRRHIGPEDHEIAKMCKVVGISDLENLVENTVPKSISILNKTRLGPGLTENETLNRIKQIAAKNKVFRSYIGLGYASCLTPAVLLRNIMENPGWYTQYTPYQPEIAQGRLESLLNFQTMVQDLTGMDVANASLLDEGTAAAEAMSLCFSVSNRKKTVFFIDEKCFPQTIAVVQTRAQGFGVNVVVGDYAKFDFEKYKDSVCGVLLQYPNLNGSAVDYESFVKLAHENGALVVCATDLLALTLLKPPGDFGADIALGNSQRFGVPLGYGGPHAAFFAVKDGLKRRVPGRLIGVSKDADGKMAYRLALQTREQHIRREKATSNICTAQALLANMAAMYAVYHGPDGLKEIAQRIHNFAAILARGVTDMGHRVESSSFFDTITVSTKFSANRIVAAGLQKQINLRFIDDNKVSVTLDETVSKSDLGDILSLFSESPKPPSVDEIAQKCEITAESPAQSFEAKLQRATKFLTHPIFNSYHSETEILRYIYYLQKKDLSLADAMIPLGSCTMKLNSTVEMIPVTFPEFGSIHPFAPIDQAAGYSILIKELEYALSEATGYATISLQPNSGAQGEYTGLRVIQAYQKSIGESHRNICLIPVSAHGTNPASASMCNMNVVTVKCDSFGNLDLEDLTEKAEKHKSNLAAIMITYPSTFGVFEEKIKEVCKIIHENGGQVYMDGANLNAQMGLCKPGEIGADVCHLNLHKTFCIPHGGGGPGMGPIGVADHLKPFLPGHPLVPLNHKQAIGPVSAAPWGSASILPISWAYLRMMGDDGLRKATQVAILNANYMLARLKGHYKILYTNKKGFCAHEFIVDCREFQEFGIEAVDIAKRLHDYGFHSPTMSFPVTNTLMVEPTESESLAEIDRFCSAMIQIRKEIDLVVQGNQPKDNNVLTNAPHSIEILTRDKWDRPYTREMAAYPVPSLRKNKFWPSISRVDDTYGDRNLVTNGNLDLLVPSYRRL